MSQIDSILRVKLSIWLKNILQLLGIPGRILVPPDTQLFRSQWFHFICECMLFERIAFPPQNNDTKCTRVRTLQSPPEHSLLSTRLAVLIGSVSAICLVAIVVLIAICCRFCHSKREPSRPRDPPPAQGFLSTYQNFSATHGNSNNTNNVNNCGNSVDHPQKQEFTACWGEGIWIRVNELCNKIKWEWISLLFAAIKFMNYQFDFSWNSKIILWKEYIKTLHEWIFTS